MFDNEEFSRLVGQGNPTGEVVGVTRFLVTVKGLDNVAINSLVLFDNGNQGLVREIYPDSVLVLNLSAELIPLGVLVVLKADTLTVGVGEALIGRVVSPLGEPLDGKGPINLAQTGDVFATAPGIMARTELNESIESGVSIVDLMFPIVLGQRIAILGDSKSGKSTFLFQLTMAQKGTQKRVVIQVQIAKRQADIDLLIQRLTSTGALEHSIVVVASAFDSLAKSYLAPYTGCAMGEYLWHNGYDVVMIYDDLSNHAKVYRELSLLSRVNPGRDSYPGDMFFAHSSLLERAGRLKDTGKTMTVLPVILTPNDDITAYLPTTVMSITDGQIIFDLETFRQGIRPAVNIGLSVSRVGGRALTMRQKTLATDMLKKLAEYRQAAQFARFGTELATEAAADLALGKSVYEGFKQKPDIIYSATEQVLIMETIMKTQGKTTINVDSLKRQAREQASQVVGEADADFDRVIAGLLASNTVQTKPVAPPVAVPPPPQVAAAPDTKGGKKKGVSAK